MALSGTHVAGNAGHVTDHNLIDTALAALPTTYAPISVKAPFVDITAYGAAVDGVTDDYTAWVNAIAALPAGGGLVGSSRAGVSLVNLAAHSVTEIALGTGVVLVGQGTQQAPSNGTGQTKQLTVKATGSYAGAGSAVFKTSGFEVGIHSLNVHGGSKVDYAIYSTGAEEVYQDCSFAGGTVASWKVSSSANRSHADTVRIFQDQTASHTADAMCLDHAGTDWFMVNLQTNGGGGPTVPSVRFAGSVQCSNAHFTSGGAAGNMELASGSNLCQFSNLYLDGCSNGGNLLNIKSGGGSTTAFASTIFYMSSAGETAGYAINIEAGASSPGWGRVLLKAAATAAFARFLNSGNASVAAICTFGPIKGTNAITSGAANLWNNEPGIYSYYDEVEGYWYSAGVANRRTAGAAPDAHALKAFNADPATAQGTQALAASTNYVLKIPIPGDVTSVVSAKLWQTNAAGSCTGFFACLMDEAGNVLANSTTGDISASFNSVNNGMVTIAFPGTVKVKPGTDVFLQLQTGTAVTLPTLTRLGTAGINMNLSSGTVSAGASTRNFYRFSTATTAWSAGVPPTNPTLSATSAASLIVGLA